MSLTYSGNIVRQQDSDRFLLSLLMPTRHRPALWALFAFNFEIAKTREVVTETTIGLIRLQWWREAIAEIYDGRPVRKHEVVDELAKAIADYNLPRPLFENLIYAREFDLEGVAPANMDGFINYCDFTTSPLHQLALQILGESEDESILKAISVQYAAIGLVRAVPYMMTQRRVMLPQDVLTKNKVSEQKLLDFNEKENLSQVVQETIDGINQLRYDAPAAKTRFLRVVGHMATLYTNQIESVQHDVFDSRLVIAPRCFAFRLWVKNFI